MKDILKKHRQSVLALGYSDEQADDLIHRLSAIMSAFIDAAWGVHPAQLSKRDSDKKCLPGNPECGRVGTKAKQFEKKGNAVELAER